MPSIVKLQTYALVAGIVAAGVGVYLVQRKIRGAVGAPIDALTDFAGYVRDGAYSAAGRVADAAGAAGAAVAGAPVEIVNSLGAAVGLPRTETLNNDPAKASRWGTGDTAGAWLSSQNNVVYETVSAPVGGSFGSWIRDVQERITGTGAYGPGGFSTPPYVPR